LEPPSKPVSFLLLQTRLDIDTVYSQEEHLQPVQRALLPLCQLGLPAPLKAGNCAGPDRGFFTKETSQGQVKVPQDQTVKIELLSEAFRRSSPVACPNL